MQTLQRQQKQVMASLRAEQQAAGQAAQQPGRRPPPTAGRTQSTSDILQLTSPILSNGAHAAKFGWLA